MKRVFILFVLLLLPLARVGAQGLNRSILLVTHSTNYWPDSLAAVVSTFYSGTIIFESSLPFDISGYDAILISFPYYGFPPDTIPVADQLRLIAFVKNGGKLYIESGNSFLDPNPNETFPPPNDTLMHFLGLQSESFEDIEESYSGFWGVDSEFTRGFHVPHAANDPTDNDVLASYEPLGNIIPVLFGSEVDFQIHDIFAWVPSDTSLRAVVQYHPTFHGHPYEYYRPFLTLALCNYFGLCLDAVQPPPISNPISSLTVRIDGSATVLKVDASGVEVLDITNDLGTLVYQASTHPGESRIIVPSNLPRGTYFAQLRTSGISKICSFVLLGQ